MANAGLGAWGLLGWLIPRPRPRPGRFPSVRGWPARVQARRAGGTGALCPWLAGPCASPPSGGHGRPCARLLEAASATGRSRTNAHAAWRAGWLVRVRCNTSGRSASAGCGVRGVRAAQQLAAEHKQLQLKASETLQRHGIIEEIRGNSCDAVHVICGPRHLPISASSIPKSKTVENNPC